MLDELGLAPEILTYRLCFLFPAVVASRLPGKLTARKGDTSAQSDLHAPPGALVNGTFLRVLRLENALVSRGVPLPFGSSVFTVARKP